MKAYRNKKRYVVNAHNRRILHQKESEEWYTPKKYIDAVYEVLGDIDLDPASCPFANKVINAKKIYTLSDDGLQKKWEGKVFLNPPYGTYHGKSNQSLWSNKLIQEYNAGRCKEAILIANASTSAKWFVPLWDYPICFVDHRIRFYLYNATKNSPTHNSVFVYLGRKNELFQQVFSNFGHMVLPTPPN